MPWLVFFLLLMLRPPRSSLFPYTTLFRSHESEHRDSSYQLFCMDWFKHVSETSEAENCLLATGYSCRSQVFRDRKSTRLNSSHMSTSYAVFCLKKKNKKHIESTGCTALHR